MLTDASFAGVVASAARRYRIPGIAAAVVCGSTSRSTASGVLNMKTNVDATPDSIFQIGSITKVFTGTLVMQLVDAGRVDIDAPVSRYLPELRIAAQPVSEAVTVRTLLAHTSGIAGDFFVDTGRNDDATQRYVERCSELRYITEPGIFSYCNSGYGILGRLIEIVGGAPWVTQLRAKLLVPLGIEALVDPEEAMLYRLAAGHILTESGDVALTPTPYLPRSTESVGARLTMSPPALLRFAQMHLRNGLAADGTRVLSERSARLMREVVVELPVPFYHIAAYGLAWAIRDPAEHVVGHNGGTIGQSAFLLLFPHADLALAVLTNLTSGTAGECFEEILAAVLESVGIARPAQPADIAAPAFDPAPLVGCYRTEMSTIVVRHDGTDLIATVIQRPSDAIAPLPDQQYRLEPAANASFAAVDVRNGTRSTVGFTMLHDGIPRYLFWGGRLAERGAA